jgi:hypothetical protein
MWGKERSMWRGLEMGRCGEGWKWKRGGGVFGRPEKMAQEVEGTKSSFILLGFESILNSNQI